MNRKHYWHDAERSRYGGEEEIDDHDGNRQPVLQQLCHLSTELSVIMTKSDLISGNSGPKPERQQDYAYVISPVRFRKPMKPLTTTCRRTGSQTITGISKLSRVGVDRMATRSQQTTITAGALALTPILHRATSVS